MLHGKVCEMEVVQVNSVTDCEDVGVALHLYGVSGCQASQTSYTMFLGSVQGDKTLAIPLRAMKTRTSNGPGAFTPLLECVKARAVCRDVIVQDGRSTRRSTGIEVYVRKRDIPDSQHRGYQCEYTETDSCHESRTTTGDLYSLT